VLPSLCRIALENAFIEAAWIRYHRSGGPEHVLQAAVTDADKLMKVAALALFGAVERTGDVYQELRTDRVRWPSSSSARPARTPRELRSPMPTTS
jgi:hypothetical protein